MLRLPCFRVIVPHCIVRLCGPIIRNQHLQKFVLHSTILIEKCWVFLRGAVQVQCMHQSLKSGIFPNQLKIAKVTSIYKKK